MTILPDCFTPRYYRTLYPDIAKAYKGDAIAELKHYRTDGIAEGRSPNMFFLPRYYLAMNHDVAKDCGDANMDGALRHWCRAGIYEGRIGSPIFDPQHYLLQHVDVAAQLGGGNFKDAYSHWLCFGIKEGRQTTRSFETAFDRAGFILNADFAAYRNAGIKEGLLRSAVAATLASDETLEIFEAKPYREVHAGSIIRGSDLHSTVELVRLLHDVNISFSDIRRQLITEQDLSPDIVDKAIIYIIQKLSAVEP